MSLPQLTKALNAYSPLIFERARIVPVSFPINLNQVSDVSGGNQPKVADLGNHEELVMLTIPRVSETQRNNLLGFLADNSVKYKLNTFTFTDEDSVAHTVRFWQDTIDIPKVKGGKYNIDIILRKE